MSLSKEDIKEFASGVSQFYFNKCDEINPELIAYSNRITFNYNNYGNGFDGMLEYRNSKFHIYINSLGNEAFRKRSNFTFGHELGHYFLPHHVNAIAKGKIKAHLSKTGYKSTDLMEQEADLFSSYLLMPEFLIRKIYKSYRKFDPKIFDQIVCNFNVSPLAAIYRVLQLDLHPIMIIRSINGYVNKVTGRSRDFYFKLNHTTILPEDSLAKDFLKLEKSPKKLKIFG